ncbi:MAG: hypothetical protein RIB59_17030 [Rhodospirillales bacterium]
MFMRGLGLVSVLLSLAVTPASAQQPSPLRMGYCASDFETCYTACRNTHPGLSFADDRARVACGQACQRQRNRCEGRPDTAQPSAGGEPQRQYRPMGVQRAPSAAAGDAPVAAPQSAPSPAPQSAPQSAPSPASSSSGRPAARAEPPKKDSGFWGWFGPRERRDTIIPGK